VEKQIQQLLDSIESQYQVDILLAVESGSRAWGFPSLNSDYDIRFIYYHKPDWYFSVFHKRDVVENLFVGELDASGWDLRKSLQLMRRGNAPLYEWLGSPYVYRMNLERMKLLLELASRSFNPKPIYYHYISLAKKKIVSADFTTNAKSFLYGFRALLCAKWVVSQGMAPPVEIDKLVACCVDSTLNDAIDDLLEKKKDQEEQDSMVVNPQLTRYTTELFDQLRSTEVSAKKLPSEEEFDSIFRRIVLA
jgi:predicted nucleotidyltransferase